MNTTAWAGLMSSPREAEDVKLISSIFSPHKELIDRVIGELEQTVGLKDWISPELLFDRTKYYAREMGWPLHRRFISFESLIRPRDIVEIKRTTNMLTMAITGVRIRSKDFRRLRPGLVD